MLNITVIERKVHQTILNTMYAYPYTMKYQERKDSFELFGFDFTLDDQLNVWLLEVNATPTMENSTEITTKMCP